MKKILINASNLHVGGGVQVAASFITELSQILKEQKINADCSVIVSTSVKRSLSSEVIYSSFSSFKEINVRGFFLSKDVKQEFSKYDVVFTVFGPLYTSIKSTRFITGFAQPWIAYPNNLAFKKLSLLEKIKSRLNFFIKELYFKKSDALIVEAEHVRNALHEKGYTNIFVVSNTVSAVFSNKNLWEDISYVRSERFTLGFIGRNYDHKNLRILKSVNELLLDEGILCDFLFTLTPEEMRVAGFDTIKNFHTVGEISVNQCPSFYESIDAVIFPSLLECFSATPIEAMVMKKILIASDLPFVTEVCKDSAHYFDPNDVVSIFNTIKGVMDNPISNESIINSAKEIVRDIPSARSRAQSYLDILVDYK
ncbi:glycosyltransferase [Escherichia coli]|uniref:glycosyltransferase n=1 Tax=Escherichia coli TaxID=562 RepID=UPI002010A4CB|nr:glycosyltransferase [Escherichia coli]